MEYVTGVGTAECPLRTILADRLRSLLCQGPFPTVYQSIVFLLALWEHVKTSFFSLFVMWCLCCITPLWGELWGGHLFLHPLCYLFRERGGTDFSQEISLVSVPGRSYWFSESCVFRGEESVFRGYARQLLAIQLQQGVCLPSHDGCILLFYLQNKSPSLWEACLCRCIKMSLGAQKAFEHAESYGQEIPFPFPLLSLLLCLFCLLFLSIGDGALESRFLPSWAPCRYLALTICFVMIISHPEHSSLHVPWQRCLRKLAGRPQETKCWPVRKRRNCLFFVLPLV